MDMPKHFTLAKDNPDHFLIHDARDNTHFQVSKKGLHPATQIKVMKMQKLADGGDVEDEDTGNEVQAADAAGQQAAQGIDPNAMVPQFTGAAPVPAQQGWQAPMLPPQPGDSPAPAQEGQITAPPAAGPADPYAGIPGMKEQADALKMQAGAQQGYAHDQQNAMRDYQNNLAAEGVKRDLQLEGINQEQAHLQAQLQAGKIDPHRLFSNMNTGQRIGSAIAMVLSGIGSGLSHQPNLAMQVMNKAVDDDIEAQKADLGKTHSLLSLNMQKYHNAQAADAATRLQYNTVLQSQLQAAQAKATNGMSAAALQGQLGHLQQQAMMYKQQMVMMGAKAQSLGAGGAGEGGIPEGHEPPLLLMDPKYQESRVVANGRAYMANDKEAAGKVRDVETLAGPVLSGVQQLKELANDPSAKFAGTAANNKAHAIMGDLSVKLPLLSGATIGAKRVNEAEINLQKERFQDPTRFDQALGSVRNDQFFKSLEEEVEGMRRNHLIGYKGMASVPFTPAKGKLPLNGR